MVILVILVERGVEEQMELIVVQPQTWDCRHCHIALIEIERVTQTHNRTKGKYLITTN